LESKKRCCIEKSHHRDIRKSIAGLHGFRNSLDETFKFPKDDLLAFHENRQPKTSIVAAIPYQDQGRDNKIDTRTKLECTGWIVEDNGAVGCSLALQSETFYIHLSNSYHSRHSSNQTLLKSKLNLSRIFLRTPSPKFKNTGHYHLSVELNAVDTHGRDSATAVHFAFASVDDHMVWLERMKVLVMHYELSHFKILHERLGNERGSWTDDNRTDVRVGFDDDMTQVSLGMQTQNTHNTNVVAIPTISAVDTSRQSDNRSENKKPMLVTVEEPAKEDVVPFSDAGSSINENQERSQEKNRLKAGTNKNSSRIAPALSDLSAYMSEASEPENGAFEKRSDLGSPNTPGDGKVPWFSGKIPSKRVTLTVEPNERKGDTLASASAVADPDDINAFLSDNPEDDESFHGRRVETSPTPAIGQEKQRAHTENRERRHSYKGDHMSAASARTPTDGLTLNLDFTPKDEAAIKEAAYEVALDSGKSDSLAGYVIEDRASSVGFSARTPMYDKA